MVNNGSLSYDHDRDGTHTMLGGCEVKFRNKAHETVVAVRYEGDRLTLSHDFDNRQPHHLLRSQCEVSGHVVKSEVK